MNTLVTISKEFKLNDIFLSYIKREAKSNLTQIDRYEILDSIDELDIDDVFKSDNMIFVIKDNLKERLFSILSKKCSVNLISKDGLNLPSNLYTSSENSYVFNYEDRLINVIIAKSNRKLPPFLLNNKKVSTTLNVFGIDEDSINLLLSGVAKEYEADIYSYEFVQGWSKVFVKAKNFGRISSFVDEAKDIFPDKVVATENIIEYIIERFSQNGKILAISESCTGGMLSSMFVKESGSSEIFEGGLVTYSNKIKNAWLSVKNENLEHFGAVSEAVIKDMLEGSIKVSGANLAVAISGVAGPNGGTVSKPIGTVFIGVRDEEAQKELISRVNLDGDRNYIQEQACYIAIMMLLEVAKDGLF